MPRRTALIIPVPEAEPAVGALRLAHDPSAALGVPAHVTVLFPFAPIELVDRDAVAALVCRFPAFDFALDRLERWDEGIVWLHPEPSRPFVDLTAAVAERWPRYPPYEGAHDEVVPHLTVSMAPIDAEIALPIACRAREVLLIAEREADGRWDVCERLPLAAAQGVA
jgi:2'-5' RNA ligase superfamily